MFYGFAGRGFGGRGWGFGFRGNYAPWPYVGLGRGGLPRCAYYFGGATVAPVGARYPYYRGVELGAGVAGGMGYRGSGYVPFGSYAPGTSREQELDSLRDQAQVLKGQLEQIDVRLKELESEAK